MCKLFKGCKHPATLAVLHKAVGARAAFSVPACTTCASRIGSTSPEGALINLPDRENRFYKITIGVNA